MAHTDSQRWNERYDSAPKDWYQNPRSFLVENESLLPTDGLALDLAMGVGQNASFLVDRGLRVVGVDISSSAVFQAKHRDPRIQAVIADLDHFSLPDRSLDVILNFYYLQRSAFPMFGRALRPGGLLVFETLTRDILSVKPDIDPQFLLESGELLLAFEKWEILVYREGWVTSDHGNQKAIASLIARHP